MVRPPVRRTPLRGAWLLLATSLAAGCGRKEVAVPPAGAALRWHAVRGNAPSEPNGVTLEVLAPCRVALRYESPVVTDFPASEPRALQAGSSVMVTWSHTVFTTGVTQVPPAADRTAGHTEPHVLRFRFGYEDGLVEERTTPLWTRPGRGRVLFRDLVPPMVDEDLPVGARRDLSVAAVVDVEAGEARLVPTAEGSRVRLPSPGAPGDRFQVVRLWLEVLPP